MMYRKMKVLITNMMMIINILESVFMFSFGFCLVTEIQENSLGYFKKSMKRSVSHFQRHFIAKFYIKKPIRVCRFYKILL